MPKVNNGVEPHPDPQAGNRFFSDRGWVFEPFPPLALPANSAEKQEAWHITETLSKAMEYIDSRIKKHEPCNEYFRKLPLKRSFADIWNDPKVWLNYGPNLTSDFGMTRDSDVLISKSAFVKGHLVVAATIVHELAHVDGAPGKAADPNNNQAETALKYCLLTQMFDPNVFGILKNYADGPADDSDRTFVV